MKPNEAVAESDDHIPFTIDGEEYVACIHGDSTVVYSLKDGWRLFFLHGMQVRDKELLSTFLSVYHTGYGSGVHAGGEMGRNELAHEIRNLLGIGHNL